MRRLQLLFTGTKIRVSNSLFWLCCFAVVVWGCTFFHGDYQEEVQVYIEQQSHYLSQTASLVMDADVGVAQREKLAEKRGEMHQVIEESHSSDNFALKWPLSGPSVPVPQNPALRSEFYQSATSPPEQPSVGEDADSASAASLAVLMCLVFMTAACSARQAVPASCLSLGVLVVLGGASAVGIGLPPPVVLAADTGAPPPPGCDLLCWLENLTITIPDPPPVTEISIEFYIKDLTCHGVRIDNIKPTLTPPLQVAFGVTGVEIQCSGNWGYKETLWPHQHGDGGVTVAVTKSSIDVGFALVKDQSGLATSAKVTQCDTSLQLAIAFPGSGTAAKILNAFRKVISPIVQNELDSVICTELHKMVETNLTKVLVDVDAKILPYLQPMEPSIPPPVPVGSMPLIGNSVVGDLNWVLDTMLGPQGDLSLNKLMNIVTKNTGVLQVDNLGSHSVVVPLSDLGNLTLGLESLTLGGLNTWSVFNLLDPITNYTLASKSELDDLYINATFFVNATTGTGALKDGLLFERGQFVLRLKHSFLNSTMQVALNQSAVETLTTQEVMQPACMARTVGNVNVTKLFFNTTITQLQIVALTGGIAADLDNAIDTLFALFVDSFGPAIPGFLNGVLAGPIRLGASQKIMDMASTSRAQPCDTTVAVYDGGVDWPDAYAAVTATGVGFLALSCIYIFIVRQRNSKHPRATTRPGSIQEGSMGQALLDNYDTVSAPVVSPVTLKPKTYLPDSLLFAQEIPLSIRLAVPFFLMVNVGMFFSSNTSVGAGVVGQVHLGLQTLDVPSLFDFTLASTVRDMWKAGVYPLSLLIAVFSGGWPYMKLLIMLVAWVAPTTYIPVKKRETMLMVTDALGKWSLIDSFILTLMMVAFHMRILLPGSEQAHTSEGQSIIEVFVRPEWGFYCFLASTILSMIETHLLLALHRYSAESDRRAQLERLEAKGKSEALGMHSFRVGNTLVRCTGFGRTFVLLMLFFTILLVCWGVWVNTFAFHFKGVAAIALAYLGNSVDTGYSVVSLAEGVALASPDPNIPGIRWIQATFIMFCILMPLLHLLSLCFLWQMPLKPATQRRLFVATEVLNAWSALDVFVLSIIVACVELKQFAAFIVGDHCDAINAIMEKYFSTALDGDTECFGVIATLEEGCWILFAACLLYTVVAILVMRLCHKVLTERGDRALQQTIRTLSTDVEGALAAAGLSNDDPFSDCSSSPRTPPENADVRNVDTSTASNASVPGIPLPSVGSDTTGKLTPAQARRRSWSIGPALLNEETADTRWGPAIRGACEKLGLVEVYQKK